MAYTEGYGLTWPDGYDQLEIEFHMIRLGGYAEFNDTRYGQGKFHHYRAAYDLIWPDDDHHRWSDLMLERKCENDILVMMGSADAGKTYTTARYILVDYWAHSKNTLWLVSSTELRGAELRIWGKLKELFNRGREHYPWLPGTVLESRTCITTEEISRDGSEARLLTKGIIFIPCLTGNTYAGLGRYAGIKATKDGRLAHAGDEVSVMETSFLQAYSNWYGKPNFQGILDGNPTNLDDPLCIAGEPLEGWDNWHDNKKTQEWRSKWYGAWVIAYDGRDSPNFDFPSHLPARYPYLIGRKKLEAVAKVEGEESDLFYMQCIGKPRPGAEAKRVITRLMCEQYQAYEKAVWEGSGFTDVVALDAAYGGEGGDRCVLMWLRFGRDILGRSVIQCHDPIIVPVKSGGIERPETQIAKFCKRYCEGIAVPPAHFYFDARATLAVELAAVWSAEVNVVDFGGPATARPVSQDMFVWEGEQNTRRLKKCVEHYSKFVTELWFSVRYCILSRQLRELPRKVAEEGWKRQWRETKGQPQRVEVETKKEMKARTTWSPDFFDTLVTGVEGCRRLGFEIKGLKDTTTVEEPDDWFARAVEQQKNRMRKHELKATA